MKQGSGIGGKMSDSDLYLPRFPTPQNNVNQV